MERPRRDGYLAGAFRVWRSSLSFPRGLPRCVLADQVSDLVVVEADASERLGCPLPDPERRCVGVAVCAL